MPSKNLSKNPPTRKSKQQPAETPHDRVGCLADGRLKAEGEGPTSHIDAINYLLNRGEGLVEILKEACQSETGCQFPKDYLLSVLDILREDVEVSRRIADELDHLYRKPATAKAD
jgi:hypothetical protein